MNRDRVLVALDREDAEGLWRLATRVHNPARARAQGALRAALDTDREEQEARCADEIFRVITEANQFGPPDFLDYKVAARAVLALLEGADGE